MSKDNPVLQWLKSLQGQPMSQSPSPYGRWLGGTLVKAEYGHSMITYEVRPEMLNPGKTLHGGVMAGMIDDAMGVTLFGLGESVLMSTGNLSVDYLEPSFTKDHVRVETHLNRLGETLVHLDAKVYNQDEKLLAVATSVIIKTNISTEGMMAQWLKAIQQG